MLSNNKGAALIVTLVVLVVLSTIGAAALNIGVSDTKLVVAQQKDVQNYYVARSGADAIASYLIKNPAQFETVKTKTVSQKAKGEINGQEFAVSVTGDMREFLIESVALDEDDQEVDKIFLQMKEFNLMDFSVFADQILLVGNNFMITGNIGTNGNSITFGNRDVIGNVILGPNANSASVADAEANATGTVEKLPTQLVFPPIDEAQFTEAWPGGSTYTVTGGQKKKFTIPQIDQSGNTDFMITGTGAGGEVHLLIPSTQANPILTNGNPEIGTTGNAKLYIYYNGTGTMTFKGKAGSHVYVYAPRASVEYNGGGSGEMYGSFIVKSFTGPSSTTTLAQDPNLTMEDLLLEGVAGYVRSGWRQ